MKGKDKKFLTSNLYIYSCKIKQKYNQILYKHMQKRPGNYWQRKKFAITHLHMDPNAE